MHHRGAEIAEKRQFGQDEYPHQDVTRRIIGCAMAVHKELGPGLLESAYEVCLADEMQREGLSFDRQIPLAIEFRGRKLDAAYRLDFLVEDTVIVELKCVESLVPIHEAQLLTYLKLAHKNVGLLINFNEELLRRGLKRRIL